jgi:hypothetical protein
MASEHLGNGSADDMLHDLGDFNFLYSEGVMNTSSCNMLFESSCRTSLATASMNLEDLELSSHNSACSPHSHSAAPPFAAEVSLSSDAQIIIPMLSVIRAKLVCILSLPSMLRPSIAQDDEASDRTQAGVVQRLMHDLDDDQGGIRVSGNSGSWAGSNELIADAWDMGESFYRNGGSALTLMQWQPAT